MPAKKPAPKKAPAKRTVRARKPKQSTPVNGQLVKAEAAVDKVAGGDIGGAVQMQQTEPPSVRSEQIAVPRVSGARLGTTVREDTDPGVIRDMLDAALYGDHESAHRVFVTMELTWDRLVKNMHELRRASSKAEFIVEPYSEKNEEPTPEAIEKAKLVERVIANWKGDARSQQNSFNDFLYDICDGIGKGVSVQELVWEMVDGEWRVVRSYWCDPKYWGIDPTGEAIGIRNVPIAQQWAPFPDDKFVVGVFKNKSGPWTGYGLFRSIAWWWSVGMFARKWLVRNAELFGIPFRVVKSKPDASRSDQQALLNDLDDMGSTGCLVIPDGAEFMIQESAKNAGESPQMALMELRDKMIDILVLGQTLTTDVQNSGSRAVAEVHADVKTERKIEVSDWVAEIVSCQLIPAIINKNYGNTDELPVMKLEQSEAGDPVAMAQRDEILHRMMDLSMDHMEKRHRLPTINEGDRIIPKASSGDGTPLDGGGLFAKDGSRLIRAGAPDNMKKDDPLVRAVTEEISQVSADFLAPVKPVFAQLVYKAQNGAISDEEFEEAVVKLIDSMPEIYDRLDRMSLKEELEKAMGAAAVNGAFDRMVATPGSEAAF